MQIACGAVLGDGPLDHSTTLSPHVWHCDADPAENERSSEAVGHLQRDHGIAGYWARTLVTNYLKARGR